MSAYGVTNPVTRLHLAIKVGKKINITNLLNDDIRVRNYLYLRYDLHKLGFCPNKLCSFFIAIGEEYDDKLLNVRNSSAQSRPQ